jgi:hypothetical protein
VSREAFAYWRADPLRADAALAALRGLQARWTAAEPALHLRLYRRDEPGAARVTVMEVYTQDGGLSDAWLARIDGEGAQALAPWISGPRQLEVFAPLPG